MSGRALGRAVVVALAAVLAAVPVAVVARGGVYTSTKHGDPTTGVNRDATLPRGDCGQCHVEHATPNADVLFAPNANALCYTSGCHSSAGTAGIYAGPAAYDASAHGTRPNMVWPGADSSLDTAAPNVRPAGDWGKCVNCHDPHGYNMDGTGLIPALTFSREEKLCDVCHDGSPATANIRNEYTRLYVHPTLTVSGKHSMTESTPAAFGATPTNNRHAECEDCHNSHVARPDTLLTPPTASMRISGVSRVSVSNGLAGTAPTYTFRGAGDSTPAMEYEVCFKCHSSWTTQPVGQSNLALWLNTNNASYHPVEAAGKNPNIKPEAFANGWTAAKLTYCTDCHTSDNTAIRGAHGSMYRYLLKLPYTASSTSRVMSSNESCFDCHRYDTYANDGASGTVKGYSRFNPPAYANGHTDHVGVGQVPCYACHRSHGAANHPALIAVNRVPGLTAYTQTATGGTCTPTCHAARTYTIDTVGYGR